MTGNVIVQYLSDGPYQVAIAPRIDYVSPAILSPEGGLLTITGAGLNTYNSSIVIGSKACTTVDTRYDRLRCKLPAATNGDLVSPSVEPSSVGWYYKVWSKESYDDALADLTIAGDYEGQIFSSATNANW